jgi:membrane fusion protein, multidrug efflux system
MRSIILLTLFTTLSFTACSRGGATAATPVAAATLPADVSDLARKTANHEGQSSRTVPAPFLAETAPSPIAATGELISPMRSEVAPKQPGRVAAVFVREGARVRAGQPVVAFETEYLELDLRRAEAELSRATAMEHDAARDLERKRELIATESVSRAAFDRAQTAYESAVAARQGASVATSTIHQRIIDATLRAPFDGVIESRMVDVGEHIGDGPAFVIAQTSSLKLRFRLPEQALGSVREGQQVNATTDAYGVTSFQGRITMIGGVIDSATRTLLAEADVPNPDGRLRPGMFARVNLAK